MFLDLVVLTTTLRQRHGPTSVHLAVAHHVDFESLLFQQQLKNLGRDQTRIVVHLEGAPGQVRVEVMDLLLGEVRSEQATLKIPSDADFFGREASFCEVLSSLSKNILLILGLFKVVRTV